MMFCIPQDKLLSTFIVIICAINTQTAILYCYICGGIQFQKSIIFKEKFIKIVSIFQCIFKALWNMHWFSMES